MQFPRWITCMVLGTLFVPALPTAFAQDPSDRGIREIYQRILLDPGNPELNQRYAEIAIERGELRKALAAYERILARDPDNQAAQEGLRRVQRLLEPDYTQAVVLFGAHYESNPLRVKEPGATADDGVFFVRGQLVDERSFGLVRWRTGVDTFANFHVDLRDLDFGTAGVETGPVIRLNDVVQVHPFAGGAYAWFDQRTFFAEASGGVTVEPIQPGIFNSATARFRYDFLSDSFSTRDAIIGEVEGRFVLRSQIAENDIVIFNPYYSYHGVRGEGQPTIDPGGQQYPLTFHQVGLRSYWFVELIDNVTGSLNLTVEYRHYRENVRMRSFNRRDVYISPGAQIIFSGAITNRTDIVLNYSFELNTSNDPFERYMNHVVGVQVLWRI